MRKSSMASIALVALVFTCGLVRPYLGSAAPDPALKCAAKKQKAAGSKMAGLLKCNAIALLKGEGQDACIAKVNTKFTAAFAKIEADGGCAITGDLASIDAVVNAAVAATMALETTTECNAASDPCSLGGAPTSQCQTLDSTGSAALLGCVSFNAVPTPVCVTDFDCQLAQPPGSVCVSGVCRYAVN